MPRIATSTGVRFPLVAACALALASTTPAAGAAGPAGLDRAERAVIAKINRERAASGLRRLRADDRLGRAADAHSADMLARNYFDHDTLGGSSWSARVGRYVRARALGEVIGRLWRSGGARAPGSSAEASRVVRLWMNSPPHRSVLLSRGLARLGVARRAGGAPGGVQTLYTVDFASRR
ncbi:MAG: hypothetical protein QOK04_2017 [Solirubrobacteraceae bacterium]|jgi:uncharacterized protein YkwD|nr:hypothetical protein [Solirubrobacteraceae bacterium]